MQHSEQSPASCASTGRLSTSGANGIGASTCTTMLCCSTRCISVYQGLTLVHFSAQRQHILWDTLGG
jgi:hypothetical protein